MPTQSERKALSFLIIVALLGGAVRIVRAGGAPSATPGQSLALQQQARAADSAYIATNAKPKKSGTKAKVSRSRRDTVPKIVAGVASVPGTYARPDDPNSHTPYGTPSRRLGFDDPLPRIDSPPSRTVPERMKLSARTPRPGAPAPESGQRVDLDVASAAEIETLPRIGPAIARRIVANRDSLGPFGSLDAVRRVKGMGPATLARLGPLVYFSGRRGSP